MDVITKERIDKMIRTMNDTMQNIVEAAYEQGYERGENSYIEKHDKAYSDGFIAGQKDAYEKATEAMLKIYAMDIVERHECLGTPKGTESCFDVLLRTVKLEDMVSLLNNYLYDKKFEEKIEVGDVCEYRATIDEPFVYIGKVKDWHFALGRKTMEKYCFKGLTGIKKTGEHITDITSILVEDKEEK